MGPKISMHWNTLEAFDIKCSLVALLIRGNASKCFRQVNMTLTE